MKIMSFIFLVLTYCPAALSQVDLSDFYNAGASAHNVDERHLAVEGYDVVEYFRSGTPTPGLEKYRLEDNGIIYLFANISNFESFRKDPDKYKPQFGGYCAFGVGIVQGEAVGDNKPGKYPINPNSFKIIDDKLYLFYLDESYNALEQWEKNESRYLQQAQRHWELMNRQ